MTPGKPNHFKRSSFVSVPLTRISWISLFLLSASLMSAQAEDTPRSSMRKGLKAYKSGDYTNAVSQLTKATLEFPAIANYNLGNTLYRNGEYEAAEKAYNEALRTTDFELQAHAYFNRGNALLARTTILTEPEQIGLAAELAFQAIDMYEKAILLDPKDLDAKCNYEKAQKLRLQLEYTKGKWLFDQAEALLQEYKAKEAQTHYQQARVQFEHVLENVEPNHAESKQYLPKVTERLAMLAKAVTDAEQDLKIAIQQINDYQYMLAAQRLNTETDDRKYAFDIKPDLKKSYEETIQKNQSVLKIIQDLSNLNIVE
jgi:tetratricopeptide (TPR) repeat protein